MEAQPRIWSMIKNKIHKDDDMAMATTSSTPYRQLEDETNSEDEQYTICLSKNIKVYNINGTFQTIPVTLEISSEQLCSMLTKNLHDEDNIKNGFCWTIVESWKDEGIERTLESHELPLVSYLRISHKANRILVLQLNSNMYDMYKYPDDFALYRTVGFCNSNEPKNIQKVLNGDLDPVHIGQVWLYDSSKTDNQWNQTVLLLKEKKLNIAITYENALAIVKKTNGYLNKLGNTLRRCELDLEVWAHLTDCWVFICKNFIGAPTNYCLCLVSNTGQKQYFACGSQKLLTYWMCAMRLSKYGKQLRDNYRSFVKKQNDANEYEYNKKPLPSESMRSHVAMDFSGNVGRIVEDPKEALAIAQADPVSVRKSWRQGTNGRTTPGLQAAVTKLENDIHLSQPWYHKNMSRDQAANVLHGLENKDGVFLIRESKSKCGSFVLTFKFSGKIVHTPIITKMDQINDKVCFTLDNGVTKFYDLLQLVEFYQLNAGSLPTRLMHFVVQVPVTK